MSFSLNKREYSDFVDYMVKAIGEEEVVQNILMKVFAEKEVNTNENYEYKKEKMQMEQKLEELQDKNIALEVEIEQYKSENSKKIIKVNETEKKLQEKEIQLQNEIKMCSNLNLQISKLDNLNTDLQEQISKLEEGNNQLKNRFKTEVNIFKLYEGLEVSTKNSLSGIFRGNTVEEFIFCGLQKQNIELLWDAIKIRAIDENYDELESLNKIFCYFFHAYNKTFENPLYELQTVEENELFDNDKFIRTSNSNSSGQVTKTILNGYINKNSNKIERKTIVKI